MSDPEDDEPSLPRWARRGLIAAAFGVAGAIYQATTDDDDIDVDMDEIAAAVERRPESPPDEPPVQLDWKGKLEQFGAPERVQTWARDAPVPFEKAWALCADPVVRLWIAHADGRRDSQLGASVAWLLEEAVDASDVTPEQRSRLRRGLTEAYGTFRAGRPKPDVNIPGADAWTGRPKELANAIHRLLHREGTADMAAALQPVGATEADAFLTAALRPNGHTPLPLALDGLPDRHVVGAIYVRLFAAYDPPKLVPLVAASVDLERAVVEGGFDKYFDAWKTKAAEAAQRNYRQMGRKDLAEAVGAAIAAREERAPDLAQTKAFLKLLEDDPTPKRAALIRKYTDTL